jgi:hypothetical protein
MMKMRHGSLIQFAAILRKHTEGNWREALRHERLDG